jgi:hypothetical protein
VENLARAHHEAPDPAPQKPKRVRAHGAEVEVTIGAERQDRVCEQSHG